MKKATLFLLFTLINIYAYSQNKAVKYHPIEGPFERADVDAYPNLPANIKRLLKHSAGKVFFFKTNTPSLYVKWCLSIGKSTTVLTDIASSGLDFYIKNQKGEWQYAYSVRPKEKCTDMAVLHTLGNNNKEVMVYAPLYDELKSLEIGVQENASFEKLENPFKKKIIVYGSSITQGISASRSGMAYPAILSRITGYNFINYGFNGSAKIEPEVAEMLADLEADMYVLDCVPNSSPQEIEERTVNFVKILRKKNPNAPIVFVEPIIREYAHFSAGTATGIKRKNDVFRKEYDKLVAEGVKNLHYIVANDFLGADHEGTADGTHPNDLGFQRMADGLKTSMEEIFKKINFK